MDRLKKYLKTSQINLIQYNGKLGTSNPNFLRVVKNFQKANDVVVTYEVESFSDNENFYHVTKISPKTKTESLKEELSQEEVGASALFNDLIQREYEQLNQYDSIQVTLEDKDDSRFSDVLEYIKDDINIHIGMLQACLQDLNGSEEQVEQGEDQATQLTLSESLFKEDYQVQALGDPIYAYLSTTTMAGWTNALMSYDEEKVKSNSSSHSMRMGFSSVQMKADPHTDSTRYMIYMSIIPILMTMNLVTCSGLRTEIGIRKLMVSYIL